jgi:hypothetical protein
MTEQELDQVKGELKEEKKHINALDQENFVLRQQYETAETQTIAQLKS